MAFCGFLNNYSSRLINMKLKVHNADNLTKQSKSKGYLRDDQIKVFEDVLTDIYDMRSESPPPEGKYNRSDPLLADFLKMNASIMEPNLRQMAHELNETILACYIRKEQVPCHSVFEQIQTDAGYCYQFNGDGTLRANSAGLHGGVQFHLDVLSSEYYFWPYSYSEGFIMVRVPPPADDNQSNCFDVTSEKNPLLFFSNYSLSLSGCYSECRSLFVIHRRNQVVDSHNQVFDSRNQVFEINDEFYSNSAHLKKCSCRPVCDEIVCSAGISSSRFPSGHYVKRANISTAEEIEKIGRDRLLVSIFYGQMSYEKVEETFAYTPPDLIAKLGSTLEFCVGASLLTICEFIEHGILSLVVALSMRWPRKLQQTEVKPFTDPQK
ncbi:acid-sensing ion channel 1C-like [Watersipora subatra]|uniref:acid-sensing ion channel 1C-like n=1 Tax=Watersipora subatra TaxID=2589382 RepID=UPI00355AEC50